MILIWTELSIFFSTIPILRQQTSFLTDENQRSIELLSFFIYYDLDVILSIYCVIIRKNVDG